MQTACQRLPHVLVAVLDQLAKQLVQCWPLCRPVGLQNCGEVERCGLENISVRVVVFVNFLARALAKLNEQLIVLLRTLPQSFDEGSKVEVRRGSNISIAVSNAPL